MKISKSLSLREIADSTKRESAPPASALQPVQKVLFVVLLIGFLGLPLSAQEIRIRVLNAHNGRPITNECLNIWVGTLSGPHIVAAPDQRGNVVLHVTGGELIAEAGCRGWPAKATWPTGSEGIMLTGDYYVACQEYARFVPNPAKPKFVAEVPPSYSIKKILVSGLAASNTCGKFRAKAKPGELIFFVRPRSFWERLRE